MSREILYELANDPSTVLAAGFVAVGSYEARIVAEALSAHLNGKCVELTDGETEVAADLQERFAALAGPVARVVSLVLVEITYGHGATLDAQQTEIGYAVLEQLVPVAAVLSDAA